jgi:hypothetical protein
MGSKQFSNNLQVLHRQHFDKLHAQYLSGLLMRHKAKTDQTPQDFGAFENPKGYGGFIPGSPWLHHMYDQYIESISEKLDQKAAM